MTFLKWITGFVILLLLALSLSFFSGKSQMWPLGKPLQIEKVIINHDQDKDSVLDLDDIVESARAYVATRPKYKSAYYSGGYPPEGQGVCTDVIWKAFKGAGYDLKAMVDTDILGNTNTYPRVGGRPDTNIDFRRVKNLKVFFDRTAMSLTIEVIPGDAENLKEWQAGDVVIFGPPMDHIAIVSDTRRRDGVPLILHNAGPWATEADRLTSWPTAITGHYRFPNAS